MIEKYKFLILYDNTVGPDDWYELSQLLCEKNKLTSEEKLSLIRKPNNLYKFCEKYPHIYIDNSIRTILHYYPFKKTFLQWCKELQ